MSKLRGGTTAVSLNGSGGAYVSISATQITRRIQIQEDPSVTSQGFTYSLPNDNFVSVYTIPAGGGVLTIGNTSGIQGGRPGQIVGIPQQGQGGDPNFQAATIFIKARSLTASTTKLQILEED